MTASNRASALVKRTVAGLKGGYDAVPDFKNLAYAGRCRQGRERPADRERRVFWENPWSFSTRVSFETTKGDIFPPKIRPRIAAYRADGVLPAQFTANAQGSVWSYHSLKNPEGGNDEFNWSTVTGHRI
jgi:hypothetical protein